MSSTGSNTTDSFGSSRSTNSAPTTLSNNSVEEVIISPGAQALSSDQSTSWASTTPTDTAASTDTEEDTQANSVPKISVYSSYQAFHQSSVDEQPKGGFFESSTVNGKTNARMGVLKDGKWDTQEVDPTTASNSKTEMQKELETAFADIGRRWEDMWAKSFATKPRRSGVPLLGPSMFGGFSSPFMLGSAFGGRGFLDDDFFGSMMPLSFHRPMMLPMMGQRALDEATVTGIPSAIQGTTPSRMITA